MSMILSGYLILQKYLYEKADWRNMGLSGQGFSMCGPLAEIHDGYSEANRFYGILILDSEFWLLDSLLDESRHSPLPLTWPGGPGF